LHWELWNTTLNGRTTNTTMRGNAGAITTIGRDKWQVASGKEKANR
jgi:hypothetical protein